MMKVSLEDPPLFACILALLVLVLSGKAMASTTGYTSTTSVDPWDIYHPLDEGLWVGASRRNHHPRRRRIFRPSKNKNMNKSNGQNDTTDNIIMSDQQNDDVLLEEDITVDSKYRGLRNDLRMAEIDSLRLFSKTPLPAEAMQPLRYDIFRSSGGQSALRNIHEKDRHLIHPEILFGMATGRANSSAKKNKKRKCDQLHVHHYRVCAALLFLRGYSDASHEMLLGVSWNNIEEAEYAARHRGQTDWAEKNPLSTAADMLHAAIHRIVEGHALGEGDHSGYDNARYWLVGGPKRLDSPDPHPVREALVRIAQEHCHQCVQETRIIAKENTTHTVLSGGGQTRTVGVPSGHWDDFEFVELCRAWADGSLDDDLEDEVATLQRAEIILLLRYELMECLRRSSVATK